MLPAPICAVVMGNRTTSTSSWPASVATSRLPRHPFIRSTATCSTVGRRRAASGRCRSRSSRMLREARMKNSPDVVNGFRMRGREVTRIESFSDAVFGFAVTLLVVSLEVPKTFDQLIETMRGFLAFAACFAILAMIWNHHYKFCRRYGLDDPFVRFLTMVLLFIVLLYVYPLKFLFNLFINGGILGMNLGASAMTRENAS